MLWAFDITKYLKACRRCKRSFLSLCDCGVCWHCHGKDYDCRRRDGL